MTTDCTVRVAVAQFHVGDDIDANLATCLYWLEQASTCRPDLVILPEFCNHLSWYDDKQHCFDVSVRLDGPFLAAIAAKTSELGIHVVVNCTVQREDGTATGSSLLYGPDGELKADNTKQIYIGHENDFLEKAREPGPVVETPLGRIGLYSCMDGVINEPPRCLALNGAQLMLNSLNSFATDEASLHIPARAAENKVYVIAANKVGPLVPEAMIAAISAGTGIPGQFLNGAGESQIVAPDGTVLAMASRDNPEFVYADIHVSAADNKTRPDGTDIFASRRPELYAPIGQDPARQPLPAAPDIREVPVASLGSTVTSEAGLLQMDELLRSGVALIGLPPLADVDLPPQESAREAGKVVNTIAARCGDSYVSTALIRPFGEGFAYCGVLIGSEGIVLEQPQVHPSVRHRFSVPGDAFVSIDTQWGRVAVVPGDDSIYPETFRLLAMQGVQIAMVPLSPLEDWELTTGLLERSAENRINLVVTPDNERHGCGFITSLPTDFTVMTEWAERPFDGLLSQPEWHRASPGAPVLMHTVNPANAANKVVSRNTDLLADRPWRLCGAITRATGGI